MLIDTLMKQVLRRYKEMVNEMNEDYNCLARQGDMDSEVDTNYSENETNLVWVRDIHENIDTEDQENYLDLAAASILLEELIIKSDQ